MFQRSFQSQKPLLRHLLITRRNGLFPSIHPYLDSSATSIGPRLRRTILQTCLDHSSRRAAKSQNALVDLSEPTIYALSTASGKAAIAIIRCSGPACSHIYESLCPFRPIPKPRIATIRSLYDTSEGHKSNSILDSEALVLFFPGPRTVSGEDVLEFHVHGGPAIVKAVLLAIGKCSSSSQRIRYAEPGEFTRRAFMNGRLDLPQVEALGDTLSAVTEEQRRLSVQGTMGGLGSRYESWRRQLLHARGELEALIDFSEDQHFDESPAALCSSVAVQIGNLIDILQVYQKNAVRGELLRHGITLSLIGQPNVGKSSLLNLIVGRHAAIVSSQAGTTRDIVEVFVDLAGFYCRVGDTAGLRLPSSTGIQLDEVEQEGIKRARARAMSSEVIILVVSVEFSVDSQELQLQINEEVLQTARELAEAQKEILVVVNKMDQYGASDTDKMTRSVVCKVRTALPFVPIENVHGVSCRLAEDAASGRDQGNLQAFLDGLVRRLKAVTTPLMTLIDENDSSMWTESLGTTERQRSLLESCLGHLKVFQSQVSEPSLESIDGANEVDIVVAAESLRAAAVDLAKITGRGEAGDVEEVLGVVFEKFCVGK